MTELSSAEPTAGRPRRAPPAPEERMRWKDLGVAAMAPLRLIFGYFGEHSMLLYDTVKWLFRRPFRLRLFLEQMEFVGVGSLPIILLVGFFSGAVASQQAIAALEIFRQERYVGATVGLSLAQELAPVFTALMITARAGSGMATELGSMRITEQIDALSTFAVNPVQYLISPRLVATFLMMPVMTMVFNVVGLFGAYLYAIYLKQVDLGQFIEYYTYWTDPKDYIIGATKAAVFGIAVALTACYQGFNVRGGAKEVGLATTRAVVAGSVSVLVLDYFLIDIFHILWPYKS
ncbi:MAG TPA: ABC transporter permease [Polyangia bacterium]|jgi:phospholipid/cholesterol/gamma-HCH transport system permease protein